MVSRSLSLGYALRRDYHNTRGILIIGAALTFALLGAIPAAHAQRRTWAPYNVEAVSINPAANNTSGFQFVLGYQIYDTDTSDKTSYHLEAGYDLIAPALSKIPIFLNLQRLNICDGIGPGGGTYTKAIPGITSETVAATAANPGAKGRPDDTKTNFVAAHVVAPVQRSGEGVSVAWNVIIPTGEGSPADNFDNTNADKYLACYKYRITTGLLGGQVVPDGNAAACATQDGQSLMATTIVGNNGGRGAHLYIAVYQLQGGLAPNDPNGNYKNGNTRLTLNAGNPSVRRIALIDAPGNVRFDPSDWNGNIAVCVTRNVGDPTAMSDTTDKHEELNIVWLAIYSKRKGTLLTHFRLGYSPQGDLTAYKNNHVATVAFPRTDPNTSPWLAYSQRVPAEHQDKYKNAVPFADNSNYGLVLKTGMDGRAHLLYLNKTGQAYEEVYSWGDGGDGGGRSVFYLPNYDIVPGFPTPAKVQYRQQYYNYTLDGTTNIKDKYTDQIAPIFYAFGLPTLGDKLDNDLQAATVPVTQQSVSANGTLFLDDVAYYTFPYSQWADHATVKRVPQPLTLSAGDTGIRYVPVGFIEGPPPYDNANLAYPNLKDAISGNFFNTTYTVSSSDDTSQEYIADTGVSLNTKAEAKFIVSVSADVNANWKQSKALTTTGHTAYDKQVNQQAYANALYDANNNVTGYAMNNTGTLLLRKVHLESYHYYALDPLGDPVPGSDSLRIVLGSVPGYSGINSLSTREFDMDLTKTTIRPGVVMSYLTPSSGAEWLDLKNNTLLAANNKQMIFDTSWSRTQNSNDTGITTTGNTVSNSSSHDLSYLLGVSAGVNIAGIDLSLSVESGQSFTSQETITYSTDHSVSLTSNLNDWPDFDIVSGHLVYTTINYETFLLRPSGRWLQEFIGHLTGNPTNQNQEILSQLLPGAGMFKITYRIDKDDSGAILRR